MSKPQLLITGVLGYIASKFLDTIDLDDYNVIGIDNNFLSDRVIELKRRGIQFYHKDLFSIKDLIGTSDIIIHCAGITQVPSVKSQETEEINWLIHRVGTDGTREIIKYAPRNCKVIFLSSHCVFDSYEFDVHSDIYDGTSEFPDITEEDIPFSELAYGKSKRQSEKDFLASDLNFVILRLASVFGIGTNIRWKILPNLFSKMAAYNEKIRVFGSNNIKPLMGVQDLVEFINFVIKNNYNREIFNVVSEHKTVMEIAQICKKFRPNLIIEEINEETPNSGYTLSNKKILSTGFKFKQNLEDEIGKMINFWSNK